MKHTCRRRRSAYGDNNVKRVFEQGLHPIYDKHVPHPELWLICKPFQDTSTHLVNAVPSTEPAAERGSVTVRFLDELAKQIDLEDTAVRSAFSSSEADSEHYANAVVGRLASAPGVSAAGTSGDPDFWLPWTGFREARSIIRGAPIARGTLSRNKFIFNGERAPGCSSIGMVVVPCPTPNWSTTMPMMTPLDTASIR